MSESSAHITGAQHGHNVSSQHHVEPDSDLALNPSRGHHHQHIHHGAHAEEGRADEVIHSEGTTSERSTTPGTDPQGHHRRHHLEQAGFAYGDAEQGGNGSPTQGEEEDTQSHSFSRFYVHWRIFFHIFIFLLFTGWWIAGLILHRKDLGWVVPFLLWFAISLRLLFFHVPIMILTKPMHWVWNNTGVRFAATIPEKLKIPLSALVVIAVILIGSFVSEEAEDNTRPNRAVSLFGLVVLIAALYATSHSRKDIKWHTVIVGMLVQFIIALFVLRTGVGYNIFTFISGLARDLLGFAGQGTSFLTAPTVPKLGWFLTAVIPAIIFFVSLVQLLYHNGVLQWLIGKFAVFFFWSMRVSGAEAVVAAASPFVGQGESAMLIRPFVAHLTAAELHQVMCSGFATISGSVLVAYIGLGVNPQALISSCVMSIPASLAISKLRYPETEGTLTAGRVVIPDDDEHRAANSLHALASGAWLGLKIGGMIVAVVLCVISLLGLADGLLTWWGYYLNIDSPPLTIQLIVGYICYPIAFLLGVSQNDDLFKVAQLIGIKLITACNNLYTFNNEFVAYTSLQTNPAYAALSPRSRLIATYALCGFANISALGIQIGVLSQIAPGRASDVSRLAVSALISGALSTLTSACIAGLLVTDQRALFTPTAAP
ncbi:hypothetical protein FGG08_006838 [Glutinoglossum americanum]|uniref:Solute carrier family 28 member 3 n=1 Tax=Glutinoglossum americanum TaxID=1670608 RepID=A0A9P8I0P7_9PEZI|nr:hypothetical protein FGG08_006838 [Glutinoglossum americanum]